ncbi:TetR/AcrR family transcriptional regulator [Clostridium sp. MB40-C1]|uniref:TetR/AcrR family transcriptional regulator n=1 Tax=Clostridium sp. MB40-C1 TaxID=3070996 RepID=UPI0027E0F1F3|nr:TetR/AcrR family transcriptional regulator [Clostridium sp. MB40-C1]WMJ79318.1 TetR/AcrR family transcriptional regulator [Clostridium sp. MB40-C1]
MGKERQLRKQEEIKKLIVDTARNIISKEGIEGLSIRKITSKIEYSPAIIYHYFKDKNEIVESVMMEGYKKILNSIKQAKINYDEPEKEIKEVFTNYIKAALEYPEEYKAFMLNDNPSILNRIGILEKGISQKRQSLQLLCNNIQRGVKQGRYIPCDAELTAQIIWTSTFGLIIRLIIENNTPKEQVDNLIERHFTLLFDGLILTKEE